MSNFGAAHPTSSAFSQILKKYDLEVSEGPPFAGGGLLGR